MWVPGHVGIRGNEAADRAAKEALDKKKKNPTADLMPFSDLKPLTAKYVYQSRQKEWDETVLVYNMFHESLPKLPDKRYLFVIQGNKTVFIDNILVTLI